ncbi:MAG: sulfatase [Deltaproteobacteria bacterium]|nr:sulfatase [Deltaproteobacteria bacterium]
MQWPRIRRGARLGAAAALFYFAADTSGMFLAIGGLFDPTWASTMLLLVTAVWAALLGAALGAVLGGVWRWPLPRLGRSAGMVMALFVWGLIAGAGFLVRVGRNHPEPDLRPPLGATRPAPVLWVLMDALRADTLYDNDFGNAPGIGAFARDALVFTDAESTASWTIPSVATLFTGIHNTTMDASAGFLPDWAPTVAEHLRAAGYQTHAVVDNPLLEARNGFAAGFETFSQRSGFRFAFSSPFFRMLPEAVEEALRFSLPVAEEGAQGVTDQAISLITRAKDAPFFLYVHYMDPHAPYYVHPDSEPDPPDSEPINFWKVRDQLFEAPTELPSDAQLRWLEHRYTGEVRYLDQHVGRLLSAWQQRFGDTGLVVMTADHGEEFFEHGFLSHSHTVHREVIRVPLIVKLPANSGVPARRIHTPVGHIDVLPTTLDVVGAAPQRGPEVPIVQGRSWLPWLQGAVEPPARALVAHQARHGRRIYRYREGAWVYLKSMYFDGRPTETALFNLDSDPEEKRNILGEAPAQVRDGVTHRFEQVADALWFAFDRSAPTKSEVAVESLRALGYIQ